MKKLIDTIAADRITRIATVVSLAVLTVSLLYTLIIYGNLPPYLPLFNQLGWGDPRLGEKYLIFIPIVLALVIVISNIIITSVLYTRMPLVSRMITITSFLLSILTLIFLFRVTQLVL